MYGFVKLESSRAVRIKTGASLHLSEIAESLAEVLKSKESQQRIRDSLTIAPTPSTVPTTNNTATNTVPTTSTVPTTTATTALPPVPEDSILSPPETLNKTDTATTVDSGTPATPAPSTPTIAATTDTRTTTRPPISLLSRLSNKLLPSSLISTLSSSSSSSSSSLVPQPKTNQISQNTTPSPSSLAAPVAPSVAPPVRGGSGDPSGAVPVLQLDDLEKTLKPLRYYR